MAGPVEAIGTYYGYFSNEAQTLTMNSLGKEKAEIPQLLNKIQTSFQANLSKDPIEVQRALSIVKLTGLGGRIDLLI